MCPSTPLPMIGVGVLDDEDRRGTSTAAPSPRSNSTRQATLTTASQRGRPGRARRDRSNGKGGVVGWIASAERICGTAGKYAPGVILALSYEPAAGVEIRAGVIVGESGVASKRGWSGLN